MTYVLRSQTALAQSRTERWCGSVEHVSPPVADIDALVQPARAYAPHYSCTPASADDYSSSVGSSVRIMEQELFGIIWFCSRLCISYRGLFSTKALQRLLDAHMCSLYRFPVFQRPTGISDSGLPDITDSASRQVPAIPSANRPFADDIDRQPTSPASRPPRHMPIAYQGSSVVRGS